LTIRDGSFVTFPGPSGCGKTTTLRMIAGLEHNDTGRIAIGDAIVSDAARGRCLQPELRNIGMVFQSYPIWPHMTVFANAAYPLRIRRPKREAVHEKTMTALPMVEMEPYAGRLATALSGGQQQRVAIARTIAFEPSVLLLDEPLSNLDAKLREQMRVELRNLQRKLGITTVYATHDQEEAMALSNEIVVMHGGRIMQIGAPEEVYFRPASRLVADFCGSPNIFTGTVAEIRAAAGDALMTVDSSADRTMPVGEQVTVRIQAERTWALPEGKAGAGA
jgi:iron(III) transport system ATP-binding protein